MNLTTSSNSESERKEIFENYPVSKAVLTLAIPTVINQLVTTIYNLIDTFFIGKCGNTNMVAAVSLGGTALMLLSIVGNLLGIGGGSFISRCLGAQNKFLARKTSAFCNITGILCAILVGICVLIFLEPLAFFLGADADTLLYTKQYLFWTMGIGAVPTILSLILGNQIRAEGNAKHEMFGILFGCTLNLILDPVFILALHMGVNGAAIATMLSNAVAVTYYLIFIFCARHTTTITLHPHELELNPKMIKEVLIVGLPASLNNLINSASRIILNNLLGSYGATAVAAMGIVRKIDEIPMHIATGLTQGTMPLIGYNYAAKKYERMERCRKYSLRLAVTISGSLAVLCIIFAPYLISIFMKDSDVITIGSAFMRLHAICLPVMAANFAIRSVFQAIGHGPRALIVAICRQGVLYIPIIFLLNSIFGIYGVASAQFIADSLSLILAGILFWDIIRKLELKKENSKL